MILYGLNMEETMHAIGVVENSEGMLNPAKELQKTRGHGDGKSGSKKRSGDGVA